MFNRRSSFDIPKKTARWKLKICDYKREMSERMGYLRKLREYIKDEHLIEFYIEHHRQIYIMFYEEIMHLEQLLKLKGGLKVYSDHFKFLCCNLKLLVLSISSKIQIGFNYTSIHYLIRKFIHSDNYPKVRCIGLELCIIWLQCLKIPNDNFSTSILNCFFSDIHPLLQETFKTILSENFSILSNLGENSSKYVSVNSSSFVKNSLEENLYWDISTPFTNILAFERESLSENEIPSAFCNRFLDYSIKNLSELRINDGNESTIENIFECYFDIIKNKIIYKLFNNKKITKDILYGKNDNLIDILPDTDELDNNEQINNLRGCITNWIIDLINYDNKSDNKSKRISINFNDQTMNKCCDNIETDDKLNEESIKNDKINEMVKKHIFSSPDNIICIFNIIRQNFIIINNEINQKSLIKLLTYWISNIHTLSFISNIITSDKIYDKKFIRIIIYILTLIFYIPDDINKFISIIPNFMSCLKFIRFIIINNYHIFDTELWHNILEIFLNLYNRVTNFNNILTTELNIEGCNIYHFLHYFFQTIFIAWLRACVSCKISIEVWNNFSNLLLNKYKYDEMLQEWRSICEVVTRIYSFQYFKLDINNLPLSQQIETRKKIQLLTTKINKTKEENVKTSFLKILSINEKLKSRFISENNNNENTLSSGVQPSSSIMSPIINVTNSSDPPNNNEDSGKLDNREAVISMPEDNVSDKESTIIHTRERSVSDKVTNRISKRKGIVSYCENTSMPPCRGNLDDQGINYMHLSNRSANDKGGVNINTCKDSIIDKKDNDLPTCKDNVIDKGNISIPTFKDSTSEKGNNSISTYKDSISDKGSSSIPTFKDNASDNLMTNDNNLFTMDNLYDFESSINKELSPLNISETFHNVIESGSYENITIIWKRMLGIFGNVVEMNDINLQFYCFSTYYYIYEILENICKNIGFKLNLKYEMPTSDVNQPDLTFFIPICFEYLYKEKYSSKVYCMVLKILIKTLLSRYNFGEIKSIYYIGFIDIINKILNEKKLDEIETFFENSHSLFSSKIPFTIYLIPNIINVCNEVLFDDLNVSKLLNTLVWYFDIYSQIKYNNIYILKDFDRKYMQLIIKGSTQSKNSLTRCYYLGTLYQIYLNQNNDQLSKIILSILLKHLYSDSVHVLLYISCVITSLTELYKQQKMSIEIYDNIFEYVCRSICSIYFKCTNENKLTILNILIILMNFINYAIIEKIATHNKIDILLNTIEVIKNKNNKNSINFTKSQYLYTVEISDDKWLIDIDKLLNELIDCDKCKNEKLFDNNDIEIYDTLINDREISLLLRMEHLVNFSIMYTNNYPFPPGSDTINSKYTEFEFIEMGKNDTNYICMSLYDEIVISIFEGDFINKLYNVQIQDKYLIIVRNSLGKYSWLCNEIISKIEKFIECKKCQIESILPREFQIVDQIKDILISANKSYPELTKNYDYNIPPKDFENCQYYKNIMKKITSIDNSTKLHNITSPHDNIYDNIQKNQLSLSSYKKYTQFISQLGYFSIDNRPFIKIIDASSRYLRDLKQLDNRSIRASHKIAIFYILYGHEDKDNILYNKTTSNTFDQFILGLGWEINTEQHNGFLGGLDKNFSKHSRVFYYSSPNDEIIYHISPYMNVSDNPDGLISKLRHLGNDEIHLVWSEHYRPFRRGIISTEFCDVLIIIYPLKNGLYQIQIDQKINIPLFGPLLDGSIIPFYLLSTLIRETIINASHIIRLNHHLYRTNYENRLSFIKQIINDHSLKLSFEDYLSYSTSYNYHPSSPFSQ